MFASILRFTKTDDIHIGKGNRQADSKGAFSKSLIVTEEGKVITNEEK